MKHIDIWLRLPKPGEAEAIERILQQVQKLHIQMRPDIYKPVSPMMTEERLAALIEEKTALVAVCRQETEQEETIVAYADWMLREYQSPTHVFRRILYLDTLAVEERSGHRYKDAGLDKGTCQREGHGRDRAAGKRTESGRQKDV